MNRSKSSSAVPQHPMFRAMVVMGNGLAVGCGGTTRDQKGLVIDGNGKDAGVVGSSNSGGSPGSGGVVITSTGGTNPTSGTGGQPVVRGSGGTTTMGSGGTTTMGSGGSGGKPPSCPPAQYDCSKVNLDCGNNGGWTLADCACDFARPRSASDCPMDQMFVCRRGATAADGTTLAPPVPFDCSCIATQQYCGAACDMALGLSGPLSCDQSTTTSVLCGCALVVLR